jgi:D-3-phosphoglycerate dehydrogenase
MFGNEVADVAVAYLIALARELFVMDRSIRAGGWAKPRGVSLFGKVCAILGFGDIGRNVARRVEALGMRVVAYDPAVDPKTAPPGVRLVQWPDGLGEIDFLIITSALTPASFHLVNGSSIAKMKSGVRIANVARGAIVDEPALAVALRAGHVHSAALDVFETEPLPAQSPLREFDRCIFGSHNASNTLEAVRRTSEIALAKLLEFLDSST